MSSVCWFLAYSSSDTSIAFTMPFCPGLDVTRACPSGVSMMVPLVMTPLLL